MMNVSAALRLHPYRPSGEHQNAARLRDAADALRAAYRPLAEGWHAFEIATRPGRTQVVYVKASTGGSARMHSRIGRFSHAISPRTLLALNSETVLGRICIEDQGEEAHIVLKAECSMDHESLLRRSLAMAAWTADELERDLFGHDVE